MSPARDAGEFPGRRARTSSGSKTSSVVVGKDAQAFFAGRNVSGLLDANGRSFEQKTCKRLRPSSGRVHVWSASACTVAATHLRLDVDHGPRARSPPFAVRLIANGNASGGSTFHITFHIIEQAVSRADERLDGVSVSGILRDPDADRDRR